MATDLNALLRCHNLHCVYISSPNGPTKPPCYGSLFQTPEIESVEMKPLRSIPLLAALCCTALSNPLPESGRTKKLGDIFNVWGVDSSTDPPGKMILKGRNDVRARNFLDPTLPHSCADLYRHDEEAMDSELELNSRWAQSIAMNEAALQALFNPTARVLSHNVNHASAFFDLYDLREQREKSVLEHVRRQYQGIDAMMRGRGVPETKPILVCGSEQFLVRQKLTDPYKDGSDNVIKDPTTRKPVTLQDRIPKEAQDDSIYRVGPPFNSYLLIDDSTKFPSRDPKSGTLHYCQGQGEAALTMKLGYGDGSKEQTAVMVCRGDLLGDTEDLERIAVEPQRPGTSLDDMDIRAGTFYHEMFHLLDKAFGGAEVTGDALAAIVKQKQG